MQLWQKTLFALSVSSLLWLTGCNSDQSGPTYYSYVSETRYEKDNIFGARSLQVMRYQMPGVDGKLVQASALVITPDLPRPKQGWRVVVWEHGIVGGGDSCAPSKQVLNQDFRILAERLLAEGYVIIAPDYEGLGETGIHPYLHVKSAAQASISALEAFKHRYGREVSGYWMTVGQSQGGHASLATAEYAQNDIRYMGAVAAAPVAHLDYVIQEVVPHQVGEAFIAEMDGSVPYGTAAEVSAEFLSYAAYSIIGIQAYAPDFDYYTVYDPQVHEIIDGARGESGDNGQCLDGLRYRFKHDILQFLRDNPSKTVLDYPALLPNFEQEAHVAAYFVQSQIATKKIRTPVMVIQGTQDQVAPAFITTDLVDNLQALGTSVDYHLVEGAGHYDAIVQKHDEIFNFIQKNMPAQ